MKAWKLLAGVVAVGLSLQLSSAWAQSRPGGDEAQDPFPTPRARADRGPADERGDPGDRKPPRGARGGRAHGDSPGPEDQRWLRDRRGAPEADGPGRDRAGDSRGARGEGGNRDLRAEPRRGLDDRRSGMDDRMSRSRARGHRHGAPGMEDHRRHGVGPDRRLREPMGGMERPPVFRGRGHPRMEARGPMHDPGSFQGRGGPGAGPRRPMPPMERPGPFHDRRGGRRGEPQGPDHDRLFEPDTPRHHPDARRGGDRPDGFGDRRFPRGGMPPR